MLARCCRCHYAAADDAGQILRFLSLLITPLRCRFRLFLFDAVIFAAIDDYAMITLMPPADDDDSRFHSFRCFRCCRRHSPLSSMMLLPVDMRLLS